MHAFQTEMFDDAPRARHAASEDVTPMIRARLHAKLELVRAAAAMPWSDQLTIIREDNGFRFTKDLLPADEGAALWAAFNVEMDRLYAIMNEGMEPDLGD